MPSRLRRVALIYDATSAYDLKVMTGVAAYLREGAPWSVYLEETALKDQRLPDLASWRGDGVIANFDHPRVVRAVRASGLATVAFGSGYGWYEPGSGIPYLFTNNREIARLAADHLLDRGFRSFAYYGGVATRVNGWSVERERAFLERVKGRGRSCSVYRDRDAVGRNWTSAQRALGQWLRALPKPVGLMAENDRRARLALEACRSAGLRLPGEVAVIGVDNDDLLCHLSTPLLSSVEQGSRRIGYEAAALLERIMSGARPRRRSVVVDPTGVVARGSTDVLAVADRAVAEAMRYITDRAGEGIAAQEVADAAAVSRSGLDARFKRELGLTVRAAIRKTQLDRALRLTSETGLSLKEVAARTGFRSVQHMTTLFREAFGSPPARYRRAMMRTPAPRRTWR